MSQNKSFLDLIKNKRKESKPENFKGNLLEYLELVRENPKIIRLSHKRLYTSIIDMGVDVIDESDPRLRKIFDGERLKTYDYFKEEFFGMEPVISKVMIYLKYASLKGEESRKVLL